MIIKCYLYSNRARQINHKYYSLSYDVDLRLFHDLKQDAAYFGKIEEKAFVYEVEVESEDVIECEYSYLKATSFRIKKQVDFKEVVKDMQIATQTKNKIKSILEGNIDKDELFELYRKYMSKNPSKLTHSEQMKFLAILNQTKYILPILTPPYYGYIRILEFHHIPYSLPESYREGYRFCSEVLYGSNKFENYETRNIQELKENDIKLLIIARKLTQTQFEEVFQNMQELDVSTHLRELSVAAGYKIPYKYRELFYPYVVYQSPELVLDLFSNDNLFLAAKELFFNKGYKIKDWEYTKMEDMLAEQARKIFAKEEYKIIELAT